MKKIIIACLVITSTFFSQAHAEEVDEWTSFIAQFDGYVINGQTAQQVLEEAEQKALQAEKDELERRINIYNNTVDLYNALYKEEQNQRNIVAQISYGYMYRNVNPYDFIDNGLSVTHWLFIDGTELTCQHRTVKGVQLHAKAFIDFLDALKELNNNRSYMEQISKNPNVFAKKVFDKILSEAIKPFAERKNAELLAEIQKKEAEIKELNCQVVIGQTNNPVAVFVPVSPKKDITCKTSKKCKLKVVLSKQDILQIGCACGHDLSAHKIKYNT